MLRRKIINIKQRGTRARQQQEREKIAADYVDAIENYPDDAGLRLDYVDWVLIVHREVAQARTLLNEMMERWPDSSLIRHRLLTLEPNSVWHQRPDPNAVDLALETAFLNDPGLLVLPLDGDTPDSTDYRAASLLLAEQWMSNHVHNLVSEKKWNEAMAQLDRLFDVIARAERTTFAVRTPGWSHWGSSLMKSMSEIFVGRGEAQQLPDYLRKQLGRIQDKHEAEHWRRALCRVERELSYITAWRICEIRTGNDRIPSAPPVDAQWKEVVNEPFAGKVNLEAVLGGGNGGRVFCATEFDSAEDIDATLLLGADETVAVWLNGEPVLGPVTRRIAVIDEFRVPVRLKAGKNSLLLFVANKRLAWGFFLRFQDEQGRPLATLRHQRPGRQSTSAGQGLAHIKTLEPEEKMTRAEAQGRRERPEKDRGYQETGEEPAKGDARH